MNYKIEKGILYRDGEAVFGLGESYYPSFNECKFPVKPEDDRIGEMKKDLRMMAEHGFNHVRFAALGDVTLEGDALRVSTPFIDAMTEEAEKHGLSVSIRQQGFAVNLRGFENVEMVDWNGVKQNTKWFDFIRTTLHHEGVLEDNRTYAAGLARHFDEFQNVVGYQIYNEPHFPGVAMYDYHPDAIRAYRKWLVEQKVLTEQEAEHYEPPRGRKEQGPRFWALWRMFGRDSITGFLNNAAAASEAVSEKPTFSCFTAAPIALRNAYHGCDLFANGRAMGFVGYTSYIHAVGADQAILSLQADTAQCAAELGGTESWCVELDSRTYIPPAVYNKGTYTVLGAGAKGIVYYQWRGDQPVPGVPHPNSCGLLNYDGTKTNNFENAAKLNRFILKHNDLLMGARRRHEGVGLLHSDYAAFYCDGVENGDKVNSNKERRNSYLTAYTETYRALRECGVSVSITDAQGLEENPFGIRVLFLPRQDILSPEEQEIVARFREKGGKVYLMCETGDVTASHGWRPMEDHVRTYEEKVFWPVCTVRDVLDGEGFVPAAWSAEPRAAVQVLDTADARLLVLTNTSPVHETLTVPLQVSGDFTAAVFSDPDGEQALNLENGRVTVTVRDGGFVILR